MDDRPSLRRRREPDANAGDGGGGSEEHAKMQGIIALHLCTHKLDRRAREHPRGNNSSGGIFGCSNLIIVGAGIQGTMLGTACMHSLDITGVVP